MSRDIIISGQAGHVNRPDEAREERLVPEGKLLFTKYLGRDCAMLIRGNRLIAMQALSQDKNRVGAVYVARVQKTADSMDACFVEISAGEVCFLPFKHARDPIMCSRHFNAQEDCLRVGDELLVQISSEAQKFKQPTVTAQFSLTNEVAVVGLGTDSVRYSLKLAPGTKDRLKKWLKEEGLLKEESLCLDRYFGDLSVKEDERPSVNLIVRTQAGECSREVFFEMLDGLLAEFAGICRAAPHRTGCSCVREAEPAFATVLNKLVFPDEYHEIVTDDHSMYQELREYCGNSLLGKPVRLYEDEQFSLSKLYSLESKCRAAFDSRVWLRSGAYLIIEPTEALTVIDVNSGKAETKKDAEESAYMINREAAAEIAIQLRLRNLSGIIIVDFINMSQERDRRNLMRSLRYLLKRDKQMADVVDMTRLGLVEITRRKDEPPLQEQFMGSRNLSR